MLKTARFQFLSGLYRGIRDALVQAVQVYKKLNGLYSEKVILYRVPGHY